MKLCIIGGGPCGTYLAYMLSKDDNNEVHLFEKEKYLGGCWSNQMIDGKYFSEHSPRIIFNNYYNTINFWYEIGIDFDTQFVKVFSTLGKTFGYLKKFTIFDLFSLTKAFVLPLSMWEKYKVYDLIKYYNISESGTNQINDLCYSIDGVSMYIMTATEFLDTLNKTFIYSAYESKVNSDLYLIPKLEKALHKVNIHYEHELKKVENEGLTNKVSFKVSQVSSEIHEFDKVIICIPPIDFMKIIQYSSKSLKHNWGSFKEFQKLCYDSTYTGIGIQYHFNSIIKYKHVDAVGDWKVICTYNRISNCISCVVVDFELKSSFLNKTLNECSKHEIKNEVWRMLKNNDIVDRDYIHSTITPGVYKKYDKYITPHSAYIKNNQYIDYKGYQDLNVYYVGPHNKTHIPFTSYESAIQSGKIFLKKSKLYKNFLYVYKPIGVKFLIFLLIFLYIVYYIFK